MLDTQALVWLLFDDPRLGQQARLEIDRAWLEDDAAVSAMTFWEIALLHQGRRLTLLRDIGAWRETVLQTGLTEIPVDGAIGIRANELEDFHRDPADRIIVATALGGHRLVTSDRRILDWSGQVERLDARE